MSYRYIFRAVTVRMMGSSIEMWVGLESETPLDLTEWDDLIPADDMTAEELAVVKTWVPVQRCP